MATAHRASLSTSSSEAENLSRSTSEVGVLDETVARGVVDELELLGAEPLSDQRRVALPESWLVDVEAVRDDTPLDYVLAQSPRRGHENDIRES